MKLLSIDPSMTCTGWAVLQGEPRTDGVVRDAGVIELEGSTTCDERAFLMDQVVALIVDERPDVVAVEMPSEQTAGGGRVFGRQSPMLAARYGAAAGVVWAAAQGIARWKMTDMMVLQVPVNAWSAGLDKGKRWSPKAGRMVVDSNKGGRVAVVKYVYQMDLGGRVNKECAGAMADAILIGRWSLLAMLNGQGVMGSGC